ncbi:hypothetical protein BDAP_000424 [Binucleata daphniae]
MRNKKLTFFIIFFIIFSLFVLIITRPTKKNRKRMYYASNSSKENKKYQLTPERKPKNRYKYTYVEYLDDTSSFNENEYNDTNYTNKIKELSFYNENLHARFIRNLKSTLILFCEMGEDTEYGSKYDYESTNNEKIMPSNYKIFDFERDIKSIDSHDEEYDYWFNLVTYYKKDIFKDTKIETKNIYKDINLLYHAQKKYDLIFHTAYNIEQAFDYIKEQCKKRYEIKLENKSKFTTKIFFNEYVNKSNKKYSARFLANAFMHKYLSNTIFNNEILDEFRFKLYLVDYRYKTIMIRLFNKLIFVITKLHLNGFITYCKQVKIVDDESEDNFCLTIDEVKFLYLFLFEQYITDTEAKVLQFDFSFTYFFRGMRVQLNNK